MEGIGEQTEGVVSVAVVRTAWTSAVVCTAWEKVLGGAALKAMLLVETTTEVLVLLGIMALVEG